MNKSGEGFKHLQNLFPTISFAKLNEGIFIEPDIRKVITDSLFIDKLDHRFPKWSISTPSGRFRNARGLCLA